MMSLYKLKFKEIWTKNGEKIQGLNMADVAVDGFEKKQTENEFQQKYENSEWMNEWMPK